jgi:predicted secreted protein
VCFIRLHQQWTSPVYAIVDTSDDAKYTPLTHLATWTTQPEAEWRNALLVVSPDELASLWHLPNELFTAPSIAWAGPTVPEEVTKTQGEQVTIGDAVSYGRRKFNRHKRWLDS